MSKSTYDNYEPYGPEWAAEMTKLTKGQLILMLKEELKNKAAEEKIKYDPHPRLFYGIGLPNNLY